MRNYPLPFSPPLIGDEEIGEVIDSLRSGWITTGPKVKRFEQEFANFVGVPDALAVNSGTAALHLALAALGVGPGDAVITTPMTFCSTVHVIEHVGARPILVDVEPDTLNIDPSEIRTAIRSSISHSGHTGRIKAIIPVHLYGHPCNMDAILEIAREYNLVVIEDAAHALPASIQGRMVGSQTNVNGAPLLTCFSFYATKNLTTGEGGMLTGPPELVEEARIWSLHGMSRDAWKRYGSEGSWYYEVTRPGFKYNMSDIQAALGLQQLLKLPDFHARRRQIVKIYDRVFSQTEEFQAPVERAGVQHAWHLYVLRMKLERWRISRNQFIEELKVRNIATSVHFIPVHLHPFYREKYGFKPEDFPVAYREYQRLVSLPLYPRMNDQDVADVIDAVMDVAAKCQVGASPSPAGN